MLENFSVDFIVYWILAAINVLNIIWFYSMMLESKYSVKKIYMIYYLCNFANQIVFADILDSYDAKGYVMLLYDIVIVCLCFNGRKSKKIICMLENFIVSLFGEIILEYVFLVIGVNLYKMEHYNYARNFCVAVFCIWQITAFYFIVKFQKKVRFVLYYDKLLMVIVCFGEQLFLLYSFGILHSKLNLRMLVPDVLAMFVADLFLIDFMLSMEYKQVKEERAEYLEKQNGIIMQYCDKITEKTRCIEELNDYYRKQIQKIYIVSGVTQNDEKKQKDRELEQIQKNYDGRLHSTADRKQGNREKFENEILFGVISYIKIEIARDKILKEMYNTEKFEFETDFDIPENINIKALDLSALLMNMLENAVEAVEEQVRMYDKNMNDGEYEEDDQIESKKNLYHIYIKAYGTYDGKRLVVSVKNSKDKKQKICKVNNKYITTKSDQSAHGYGLQIIENIAEKYGGKMKVTYGEDWFCNEVTLFVT